MSIDLRKTKKVTLVYTTRRKLRKHITLTPKNNNDVK